MSETQIPPESNPQMLAFMQNPLKMLHYFFVLLKNVIVTVEILDSVSMSKVSSEMVWRWPERRAAGVQTTEMSERTDRWCRMPTFAHAL